VGLLVARLSNANTPNTKNLGEKNMIETKTIVESTPKGRTYAVVFLIHVRTPHEHVAKLFVRNVPENADLKEALTEAGYSFGEFGIPWANHYITLLSKAESSVKGAYRRGDADVVEFAELKKSEEFYQ
jgi:hypothetical protein